MSTLLEQVSCIQGHLRQLLDTISADGRGDSYARPAETIRHLQQTLAHEFDLPRQSGRKRSNLDLDFQAQIRKLHRSWRYQRDIRTRAEHALEHEMASRIGSHIQDIWFVRGGLSCLTVPVRIL